MLFYSLIVLIISISLMWYSIRTTVMNPVLRPRLVGTPGRIAVLTQVLLAWTIAHLSCSVRTNSKFDTAKRLPQNRSLSPRRADVAELADAHDSGSCTRKGVEVQVLSSAPNASINLKAVLSRAAFPFALMVALRSHN